MGRVIIVQPVKFDVRPAEEFGEVLYLLDKAPSPFNPDGAVQAIGKRIQEIHFEPEHDYFCFAGSTLVVSLALLAFTKEIEGEFNVLMFDASIGKYRLRALNEVHVEHEEQEWNYNE
jgi:hypothetical protein